MPGSSSLTPAQRALRARLLDGVREHLAGRDLPAGDEVPVDRDPTAAPAQDSLLGRRYYYVAGDRS